MIFPNLKDKTVIVTGASRRRGIGAAICRAFAQQGCNIFFTTFSAYDAEMDWGADKDGANILREQLCTMGIKAQYLDIDLSCPDAHNVVLNQVNSQIGAPDILINNAAHSTRDGFQNLDAAILDAHYAVNMRATFLLSTTFARTFTKGAGGRIINLSSGQSLGAMPEELAYAATKGAIEAFTRSLAYEVGTFGITVNAVDPGATDTGWMTPEIKDHIATNSQFGRVGLPQDAASLIVFLASDAAEWITGQVIHSRGV